MMPGRGSCAGIAAVVLALACAGSAAAEPHAPGETVEQALCRLIDTTATQQHLPSEFLTRLLFQESSFRPHVVSPAGAQGIAQFMPGTARERGLADPFDPEQAIPASGALLSDLTQRFGNRGLAAAAYNAGAGRVTNWLGGTGGLPFETQDYVMRVTGRPAEDWAADLKRQGPLVPPRPAAVPPPRDCAQVVADLRTTVPNLSPIAVAAVAPWGVQLAGNFSKVLALASFERARSRYGAILADIQPMIIGTRLRTRGSHAFYRVRVPAQTRAEANALCSRIHGAKGACVVLRS